ncbi:Uncharacterised protein [Bordetella pertussis]|nr:Uncharacterised protein [Bordetella pertussis]
MQGLGVNPAGDVHAALVGRIGDDSAAQPGVPTVARRPWEASRPAWPFCVKAW